MKPLLHFVLEVMAGGGEEVDEADGDEDGGDEEAEARGAGHVEEGAGGESAVAFADEKAEEEKPSHAAEEITGRAEDFAGDVFGNPFVGDEGGGEGDPKEKDGRVAEDADEADPKSGVGMESVFDDIDGAGVFGHVAGEKVFDAEEKHEHEADEFHASFDDGAGEEAGESSEGDAAIDGVHDHGAEADGDAPEEAAAGAFVDDGAIDGADWDADKKAADEPRQTGLE